MNKIFLLAIVAVCVIAFYVVLTVFGKQNRIDLLTKSTYYGFAGSRESVGVTIASQESFKLLDVVGQIDSYSYTGGALTINILTVQNGKLIKIKTHVAKDTVIGFAYPSFQDFKNTTIFTPIQLHEYLQKLGNLRLVKASYVVSPTGEYLRGESDASCNKSCKIVIASYKKDTKLHDDLARLDFTTNSNIELNTLMNLNISDK